MCNDLCKFFIKIESNCFSKTYSEIESMWSINSSKEEIVLSRDSKELFVQRFVKFFNKIESTWRRKIKEQAPQLTLLHRGAVLYCQKQPLQVLYKKAILKNFAMSTGNTRVELLKKLQTFRPATLLERDPSRGVFLWILQNFWY